MHLRCALAAIDAMPFGDSLCLLQALYDEQVRQAKFQAALHGAKLR